ncbi:MFS transporter [Microlunatus parietis]|uniref:DHA2 family multidrug resistance protein-like MFS transporter n=1 Tax=Microlunatus parietis TaxID=682979 RepID=A0A7Y9IBB8_9ACTN|nr:MFS transporter [Microlunatus parietis]NYE73692.1 DHA2 family multidrug resistance protein-like MFS transporter [Microlunatus parietis]
MSAGLTAARPRLALAVLMLPTLLVSMDMFVLHFAVPELSADLQPSAVELLWIVDVYGFLVAGSLITMGTLGDRIGRRRLLLIGAAAFAAASVLAAFSTSPAMLIIARALLGMVGASLLPSTLALIRTLFEDERERGIAFGVWVAVFTSGGAIGPLVGGALLEQFWWGSVFLLGVPAMALLLILGPVLLPESRDPHPGRLDLPSTAMSLLAVLGIVYGLKRIAVDGPDLVAALAGLGGLAVGVVFLRRQRRLDHPLIDLTLFGSARFNLALVAQLSVNAAWAGTYLFVTQHLQLVAGLTPVVAGLWTLPGVAAGVITSTLVPRLRGRLRPELVLAGVMAVSAAGCVVLATAGTGIGTVVVGAALVMAMASAIVAVSTDVIVGSAPPERAGAASSISETSSELGIAFGVALLGAAGAAAFRNVLVGPAGIPDSALGTLGGALDAAHGQPGGEAFAAAARAAFLTGMHTAAWVGAAIMIAAAATALVLARRTPEPQLQPLS